VGAFFYSDYEKVRRVKYIELWTFSLSEQENASISYYYTGDLSSNGDKQWECTRAMAKYSTNCDCSEEDGLEYCNSSIESLEH
jgi:hypothetical protein